MGHLSLRETASIQLFPSPDACNVFFFLEANSGSVVLISEFEMIKDLIRFQVELYGFCLCKKSSWTMRLRITLSPICSCQGFQPRGHQCTVDFTTYNLIRMNIESVTYLPGNVVVWVSSNSDGLS